MSPTQRSAFAPPPQAPPPPAPPPKYGAQLTNEAWPGLPLRVGAFGGNGTVEKLEAGADTVLVWTGGSSRVTVHSGQRHHTFQRESGMVDFIPSGIILDQVEWRGTPTGCTSVVLPRGRLQQLLGEGHPQFDSERGLRLGVIDAHVVDLARRLHEQAASGQPWGQLYVEALSMTFVSYVYARYASGQQLALTEGMGLSQLACARLIGYIEDNLCSNIAASDLAAVAGYSSDHFARLFKRTFRCSPHQYLIDRRVERAKSLLKDRARSILEIAFDCGFSSQAHLNVAFKQRTGVTPGTYRRG